jgi:UPF0755 protein
MMDELDLGFEEYPERGRHRHRRSAPKRPPKKRRRRGRTFFALLFTLLLLGGLGAGVWYGFDKLENFFDAPDYAGAGAGEVTVQVKHGDTATDIANTLVTKDVVKSARAFVEAADAEPRSKNIQPGFYKLRQQMKASAAVTMLLDLKNKIVTKVTIPEGRSAKQTYDLLAKATTIPAADFANAAKDPVKLGVPAAWFTRTDKKPVNKSIEGFLFPQTYEFDPGVTAEDILRQMVNQFLQVAEEINFMSTVQSTLNISPYEALIVASLAEAEAGVPEDLPKVARVAYNRLYKNFPCHCLQMDVTVNYWFELNGKPTKSSGQMTDADLHNPNNPWNTHDKAGLPPSPINNPGRAGLEGAMSPPGDEWYYFVAIDKQGHSAFAKTLSEHERNLEIARRNGVL